MLKLWHLWNVAVLLISKTYVSGFSSKGVTSFMTRQQPSISPVSHSASTNVEPGNDVWAHHALLISSFSDGILESTVAQKFLVKSLLSSLLSQETARLETKVEQSVLASPCNGPDPGALSEMEKADKAQLDLQVEFPNVEGILSQIDDPVLRFLYIPTATYALRSNSDNTPGKQRQRARADGKKRRTQVIQELKRLLGDSLPIHAVTLDFDDGSVKQPEGSDSKELFPKDGKEALKDWKPHFVYVEGGNTFWLHHCIEKGGWENRILDTITGSEAAVYCGKSAGAIIAGSSMDTATWKEWDDPSVVPGKTQYEDWKETKGLNLLGGASVFPHMDQQWESMVSERTGLLNSAVYCIDDSQICLIDGQIQEVSIVAGDQMQGTAKVNE